MSDRPPLPSGQTLPIAEDYEGIRAAITGRQISDGLSALEAKAAAAPCRWCAGRGWVMADMTHARPCMDCQPLGDVRAWA